MLSKPFKRLGKFGKFMLFIAGYELLELTNSLVLLLGAAAFLRPDTDILTQGQAFSVLSQIAPENLIGFLFLSLGLFKMVALLDGNLKFRQVVSFLVTAFWVTLFGFMFAGNPSGLAFLWVALFSFISVIVAARLRVDMDNKIPSWTQRL